MTTAYAVICIIFDFDRPALTVNFISGNFNLLDESASDVPLGVGVDEVPGGCGCVVLLHTLGIVTRGCSEKKLRREKETNIFLNL